MKKIGILMLALVLALGALGIGYANWSETLVINGDVATGDIDPFFASSWTNDSSTGSGKLDPAGSSMHNWNLSNGTWDGDRKSQDVGSLDVNIDSSDATRLNVSVLNAYPSYWGSILFNIQNLGSVPVNVASIKLTHVSKGGQWYDIPDVILEPHTHYYIDIEAASLGGIVRTSPRSGDRDDFQLRWSHLEVGEKLHPTVGSTIPLLYGDLSIHVEQGAEQTQDYDFWIEIVFENWN